MTRTPRTRARKDEPKQSVRVGELRVTPEMSDRLKADANEKANGNVVGWIRAILEKHYKLKPSNIQQGRPRKETTND